MRLGRYLSSLTKPELEFLKDQCNFSEEEEIIFHMLAKKRSITEISIKSQISISTTNRRIIGIKRKVCKVNGENY